MVPLEKLASIRNEARQLVDVLHTLEPELRGNEGLWLLASTALQLARRCASQLETVAVRAAMDRARADS